MREENFWNVFITSGDPMAYLIYSKSKDIKKPKSEEKDKFH